MNLLMTGASGFLGKKVLHALVGHFDKIYVCIRPESKVKFEKSLMHESRAWTPAQPNRRAISSDSQTPFMG